MSIYKIYIVEDHGDIKNRRDYPVCYSDNKPEDYKELAKKVYNITSLFLSYDSCEKMSSEICSGRLYSAKEKSILNDFTLSLIIEEIKLESFKSKNPSPNEMFSLFNIT